MHACAICCRHGGRLQGGVLPDRRQIFRHKPFTEKRSMRAPSSSSWAAGVDSRPVARRWHTSGRRWRRSSVVNELVLTSVMTKDSNKNIFYLFCLKCFFSFVTNCEEFFRLGYKAYFYLSSSFDVDWSIKTILHGLAVDPKVERRVKPCKRFFNLH